MKCTYCEGSDLLETGIITSGNSKYSTYECQDCFKETWDCIGVIKGVST